MGWSIVNEHSIFELFIRHPVSNIQHPFPVVFDLNRMSIHTRKYNEILTQLDGKATLVAVSKTKPVDDIKVLYDLGQRDFGENYVQELTDKYKALPKDIRWHFIGHLQSNKVRYIAPFVHLVHGVDSYSLLKEINKQAARNKRIIDCLLQVHIAREETKFGLDELELDALIERITRKEEQEGALSNIHAIGLMGMTTFTDNKDIVRSEFRNLKSLFDRHLQPATLNLQFSTLSMGMSGDYTIALEEGSNMVRIGSLIFGEREQNT